MCVIMVPDIVSLAPEQYSHTDGKTVWSGAYSVIVLSA